MSALHATEDLSVVLTNLNQLVTPVIHEQTGATSAGPCVELLPSSKKLKGMFFPAVAHSSNRHRLLCLHIPLYESSCR
jgi:hypothetical protein